MSGQYIHGSSDAREVERLEQQARYIAPHSMKHVIAKPGERVLDLGTGVGAMAQQLLERFPGIQLTGVDLRDSQLEHARKNHPGARYVQANAQQLPFPDASFDRVHASWLLEHVPDPLAVVKEVRRVLVAGGTAHFLEVDNSTLTFTPDDHELTELFQFLDRIQQEQRGDPYIGARLHVLFEQGGFAPVTRHALPLGGDGSQRDALEPLVEEMARILESVDEVVPPDWVSRFHAGAERCRGLLRAPNVSMRYVAQAVTATRPA